MPPDALFRAPVGAIEWTHRRGPGFDLYFVSNQGDAPLQVQARLRAVGAPQLWLADTGRMAPLAGRRDGAHTVVDLSLDPRGSAFVVFGAPPLPGRPRLALRTYTLPLDEPWTLRFADRLPAPKTLRLTQLRSWSDDAEPEIRFYSGSATYQTCFTLPASALDGRLELDLGEVADLAEVRLNGHEVGVAWKPPFRLDILNAALAGQNRLEVVVTNTWRNRLIGDFGKPVGERVTFVVPEKRKGQDWLPGAHGEPLLAAGLLGPVRVLG